MIFVVSRTSHYGDRQPCEEAYKSKLKDVDMRSVDSPEKLKCMNKDEWFSSGTNHRVINGHIARDLGEVDEWFVEFNSLEDLVAFKRKYGEIILTTSCTDCNHIEIEIYDTYRE